MQKALYAAMKEAVISYPKYQRTGWLTQFNGMGVITVSEIWRIYEVDDAFTQVRTGNKLAMKQMLQKHINQITDIVRLTRSNLDQREDQYSDYL